MSDQPVLALALDDAGSHAAALASAPVRPGDVGGLGSGRPASRARVRDRVRALLTSHEVPALPDGVPAELDRIVAAFAVEEGVG